MPELRLLALLMLMGGSTLCCALPPALRSVAPLTQVAYAKSSQARPDATSDRVYVAVPVRVARATASQPALGFTRDNWSSSVRQQGRVQVYIAQTPDFFEVIEQELPRTVRSHPTLEGAIADANQRFKGWSLISLEP